MPAAAAASASRFDPSLTDAVLGAMGPDVEPRTRFVLSRLISHMHDFAREVELTYEEWMAGVRFVNAVGQASGGTRNEAHRVSGILGLESLVDEIANKVTPADGDPDPTSSAILGPFWSPDAPLLENGSSIIRDPDPRGRVCKMHGTVSDLVTGRPIPGAVVDIWQASVNGRYDLQDPDNQTPDNLRGKFTADENGRYACYCYHPTPYALPGEGPAHQLLRLMDRDVMRPAHIHIMVTQPDFKRCTTQLYPRDDPFLETDTVFAVKNDLIVDFKPYEDGKATLELEYNVVLSPKGYKGKTL